MKQAGAAPRCVAALRYLSGRPPPFLTFAFPMMALFDTTSRAVGGRLGPRGRASRESHPSEDLSELPPLLVAVAGQEYHYWIAGEGRADSCESRRNAKQPATGCFMDGWGTALAPYLAVFDAGASRTDGLGASSSVASASLSGASRQRTYPSCRIFYFQRSRGGRCDPLIMYRQ